MGQKPNWGAALGALGQGLGGISAQRQREAELALQREWEIEDLEARHQNRLGEIGAYDKAARGRMITEEMLRRLRPSLSNEDPTLALELPPDFVGAEGTVNLPPAQWATMAKSLQPDLLEPTTPDPMFTIETSTGERMKLPTAEQAQYRLTGWAPSQEDGIWRYVGKPEPTLTPTEQRLGLDARNEQVDLAVRGGLGRPSVDLKGFRDPDTKLTDYADVPSGGGASLASYREMSMLDNPEAAVDALGAALRDSLDARQISRYMDYGIPEGILEGAWEDVFSGQRALLDPRELVSLHPEFAGWRFDPEGKGREDDRMINDNTGNIFGADKEKMTVRAFIKDVVMPKTDKENLIEWRALQELMALYPDEDAAALSAMRGE